MTQTIQTYQDHAVVLTLDNHLSACKNWETYYFKPQDYWPYPMLYEGTGHLGDMLAMGDRLIVVRQSHNVYSLLIQELVLKSNLSCLFSFVRLYASLKLWRKIIHTRGALVIIWEIIMRHELTYTLNYVCSL